MTSSGLWESKPPCLFISPFGISGVAVSEGCDTGFEAKPHDVDEATFGRTLHEITASLPNGLTPTTSPLSRSSDMLRQQAGLNAAAAGRADADVQMWRAQSNVKLEQPDLETAAATGSGKGREKASAEIRRAEAHLPGMAGSEPTCRTGGGGGGGGGTISIGEKMQNNKAARGRAHANGTGGDVGQGDELPELINKSTAGKDGWGVLSRNFAVSSALSSLNRDLKTFVTLHKQYPPQQVLQGFADRVLVVIGHQAARRRNRSRAPGGRAALHVRTRAFPTTT